MFYSKLVLIFVINLQFPSVFAFFFLRQYNDVNLKFVHENSPENFTQFYMRDVKNLINHREFRTDRETVFYIHGWIQNYNSNATQTVSKAYIDRNAYSLQKNNYVVVDWGQYSVGEYYFTIFKFTQIAKNVGMKLVMLFDRGLDPNKFHCVGHSFGAHFCGILGREIIARSRGKYKLKRITALDPSANGFNPPILDEAVSKDDANFVDVIHSDTLWRGIPFPCGHVDFYPNFGIVQPGCQLMKFRSIIDFANSYCSHFYSVYYWAESLSNNIENENEFVGVQCDSWDIFAKGECNSNYRNVMGINADPNFPGSFFIDTQAQVSYFEGETFLWDTISRVWRQLFGMNSN